MAPALVVAAVATAAWSYFDCVLRRRWGKLPPGPVPWPIVGNLHHVAGGGRQALHRTLANLASKHGPLVYLRLGYVPTVVVSSSELAKQVLHTYDRISANRPPSEAARRLDYGSNNSITMSNLGPSWQELRRFATQHLFTPKCVASFRPIRDEETELTLSKIQAKLGTPVDLTAHTDALLEELVCRMAVGKRRGDLKRLKVMVRRATTLFQVPVIGSLIPVLGFLDYKIKRDLDQLHHELNELMEELVQRRLEELLPTNKSWAETEFLDFLGVLLDKFSDKNRVKNLLQEFIIGAMDSSSATLDWAMAELIANPLAMKRLQGELDKVVGRERQVQEEDLAELPYLKAVVKETLRLHPPTPLLIPHMASEECVVGGYSLPKHCHVLVNAWAIGRDPDVWDNHLTFIPERFLSGDMPQEQRGRDVRGQHFELLPFGAGRRMCPGLNLGLVMVEFALARLVHTFEWRLPPSENPHLDLSDTFGIVVSRAEHLIAIPSPRLKLNYESLL